MNAIRSSGKRTGTPVSSMLTRFATIASGCASAWTANAVRNCSSWNGKTGKTASTQWIATGRPGLRRGLVDGVVVLGGRRAVLQPGRRQVDADELAVAGVPADVGRARRRVLRGDDERALQERRSRAASARPASRCTSARASTANRVAHHREREQVVGEQNRLVDAGARRARRASRRPSSRSGGRFEPPGNGTGTRPAATSPGRSR